MFERGRVLLALFYFDGLREVEGGVEGEVAGGIADGDGVVAGFGDPRVLGYVKVGECGPVQRDGDRLLLARLEDELLKGFEFLRGSCDGWGVLADIYLGNNCALARAGVGDSEGDCWR